MGDDVFKAFNGLSVLKHSESMQLQNMEYLGFPKSKESYQEMWILVLIPFISPVNEITWQYESKGEYHMT
ncbi:unnamed protein product [Bubo scandiacus]